MNEIERFRDRFKQVVGRIPGRHSAIKQMVKTLYNDFNNIFPPQVYDDKTEFQKLIARFCHEEGCPICGNPTEERSGKFGKFLGCTKYPDCKGVRKTNGDPSVNQALRDFLTGQLRMHGVKEPELPDRFTDLEL